MLNNAIDIMKYITCPKCRTKSIDTYLLENVKGKVQHNYRDESITGINSGIGTSIVNLAATFKLYLTCSKCDFTMQILNRDWIKIFHKHCFGI